MFYKAPLFKFPFLTLDKKFEKKKKEGTEKRRSLMKRFIRPDIKQLFRFVFPPIGITN